MPTGRWVAPVVAAAFVLSACDVGETGRDPALGITYTQVEAIVATVEAETGADWKFAGQPGRYVVLEMVAGCGEDLKIGIGGPEGRIDMMLAVAALEKTAPSGGCRGEDGRPETRQGAQEAYLMAFRRSGARCFRTAGSRSGGTKT